MSILVNKDSRIVCQGITGRQGSFHTEQCIEYGTQVVVYSPQLLQLGALMSVVAQESDIAATVIERLQLTNRDGSISGPDIAPLSAVQVEINQDAAQRLELDVPQHLARTNGSH